ncbi:GGDEF domain-containing protein [Eubacteriaceae bacterium ES3]|nr:GGDEF domain-containing protein [Eubacteriaceae bacterium ES3]
MKKFLQRYELDLSKKSRVRQAIPILLTFITLYIALLLAQLIIKASNINGILAQLQVVTSVLLTIHLPNSGFFAALVLNLFNSLLVIFYVLNNHALLSLPGIFIPFFTIIILFILRYFILGMLKEVKKLRMKNSELLLLNNELDLVHKDLAQQNEVLESYNQIIRQNEDRLLHLAYYDLVTDLPNRKLFTDRLEQIIDFSKEYNTHFLAVFIDLNQFRQVNDLIGITGGDFCLKTLATRLKSQIHPNDFLSHLGGDKFALLIRRQLNQNTLKSYLSDLSNNIFLPIDFEGQAVHIRASLGVAAYPRDGQSSQDLLILAESESYKSANDPNDNIHFFS